LHNSCTNTSAAAVDYSDISKDFINGKVLLINKEIGWTSFDVVNKIRHLLHKNLNLKKLKVGHAGTLDPLANGLVIICTGKETKNIHKYQDQNKEYIAELVLGKTTPSHDLETKIDRVYKTEHINRDLIEEKIKYFVGRLKQVPPLFSAKRIGGKRAYEFARKGKEIELQANDIEIEEIKIIDFTMPVMKLKIVCSKGTYIRALVRDLGISLNSGAYLSALTRTAIGDFKLNDALSLINFEKNLLKNKTL